MRAEEERKRYELEQAHQQQRALGYLSLLQASLHTVDADYRRILSDFEALGGAIEAVKVAGERIASTYPPKRIQAPKRVEIRPVRIGVEVEDTVIPMRRL